MMIKCVNPTELTAELLNTLIEKILVHEAVKNEDGNRGRIFPYAAPVSCSLIFCRISPEISPASPASWRYLPEFSSPRHSAALRP